MQEVDSDYDPKDDEGHRKLKEGKRYTVPSAYSVA